MRKSAEGIKATMELLFDLVIDVTQYLPFTEWYDFDWIVTDVDKYEVPTAKWSDSYIAPVVAIPIKTTIRDFILLAQHAHGHSDDSIIWSESGHFDNPENEYIVHKFVISKGDEYSWSEMKKEIKRLNCKVLTQGKRRGT